MKLVEINWNPTDRQLRQFGMICLPALPLIGWIWGATMPGVGLLAGVGLALAVLAVAWPSAVKPLFLALMIVATPIGLVVGEVLMLLIYFGVFWPMGMIFWLVKRDAMQRKLDREAPTYWQAKKAPAAAASYYRQS